MSTTPPTKTARELKRTKRSTTKRSSPSARDEAVRAAVDATIASDLAPAVALALLDKTQAASGAAAPALDALGAAAAPSEIEGNVRVQLMFENGAVLPVEMSAEAGAALSKGLEKQLKP